MAWLYWLTVHEVIEFGAASFRIRKNICPGGRGPKAIRSSSVAELQNNIEDERTMIAGDYSAKQTGEL